MKVEDVQFTKELTKLYEDLKGLSRSRAPNDLWDDKLIEEYIFDKKAEYLMEFEMSIANRIDYIHPEFGFEGRKRGMVKVKDLIVDYIKEKNGNQYTIKIGTVEVDNFIFVGFTVGMMAWVGQVQNKFFKFDDLSMEHIHNNIDLTSSIQDSAATNYIKDKIKPRPIADASSKKARDLFGGLMD